MKRIILQIPVIVLMLVFLVSGSGLFFNIHECHSKHISRITLTPGESCCNTAKELKSFDKDIFLPSCCANKTKKDINQPDQPIKSCCTDKPIYIKLPGKYLSNGSHVLKEVFGSLFTYHVEFLTSLFKFHLPTKSAFFSNGPPGLADKISFIVLHHQFII